MKVTHWLAIAISVLASMGLTKPALARDGVAITLPDKRVAVLSEGDLESASIGSYSIVVFKHADLLDFVAGAAFSRDGSLFDDNGKPRVSFADVTGDGTKDLVLSMLTAGSGNHLEVDTIRIDSRTVKLLVRVQTDTHHDVVAALKAAYKRSF